MSIPPLQHRGAGARRWSVAVLLLVVLAMSVSFGGCSKDADALVVYVAQDRVFADPLFAEFTQETGMRIRPLYDNEATKTVGLANRLRAERDRPQADVWWSNEELQTRLLIEAGILEPGPVRFGSRQRVLVCHTNQLDRWRGSASLAALTQPEWKGRVVLAYPVAGSTLNHFAVLHLRWGEAAWRQWASALKSNRPVLVDGNSAVVRWLDRAPDCVGLTDSDDVASAQREGHPLVAVPLPRDEALSIPNTVALVTGCRHRDAARRFAEFLGRPETLSRLRAAGALDPVEAAAAAPSKPLTDDEWRQMQGHLDQALEWIREQFIR